MKADEGAWIVLIAGLIAVSIQLFILWDSGHLTETFRVTVALSAEE